MRIRAFPAAIVLFISALLGSTFIPQVRVFGGQPDLILLFVLTWAVFTPWENGLVWAFVGGLLRDLMSAAPLGTTVLALLITLVVLDRVRAQVASVNLLTVLAMVVLGTAVQKAVLLGVLSVAGLAGDPVEQFTYHFIPSLAFNLVLTLPVYLISRRLILVPETLSRGR